MSKIDDLIQELCPKGVTYKKVGDIAVVGTGKSDKKDATPDGEYPFYVRSKVIATINRYEFDEEAIIIPGEGGIGEIFHYVNGKYALHQRAYRIHFTNDKLVPKFAYYHFLTHFKSFIMKKAVSATVTSIRKPMITDFTVPLPPLEVQKEIVGILDKFTRLDAELSAELSARQKQYEYYRNHLLGFGKIDLERSKLGNVAKYSKSRIASSELDHENYVGVDNLLQNRQGKMNSNHVPSNGNMTRFESGDVLIGNIRPYLKKIWHSDRFGGTNGDVLVIRIKDEWKDRLAPRYLYHILSSDNFFAFNMRNAKGAKMPRGDKDSIMKFEFLIPLIEEQERVASVLDKFDRLANDISEGLPAEINARRQQYEYYRTKLLTFQEMSA